jgi:thiamine biosynthesis lipoprotein
MRSDDEPIVSLYLDIHRGDERHREQVRIFVQDGIRYSHHIDPATGYPVRNGVVSVSILADNCTFADGLGTAVLVSGVEKGLALIDRLEGVEGLLVVEAADGSLQDYPSKHIRLEPAPR